MSSGIGKSFSVLLMFACSVFEYSSLAAIEQISHLKGTAYRQAIAPIITAESGEVVLEQILKEGRETEAVLWQTRILLAHIRRQDVFVEFEHELNTWRGERHDQPSHGQLSKRLFLLIRRGPERCCVVESAGWVSWPTNSQHRKPILILPKRKEVERFSDAEVAVGIERNSAARLAVLEHFLKFMEEDTPYEQSEMVLLAAKLWGQEWNFGVPKQYMASTNPDLRHLMSLVFDDLSRPFEARFWAADNLVETRPRDVCSFMLAAVTNMPTSIDRRSKEDIFDRALYRLYWLADMNDVDVLLSQTNYPSWMADQIRTTAESIRENLEMAQRKGGVQE